MAHRGRHRCPSGCRGSRHRADGRLRAPSFRPEPVCVAVLRRVAKVDPRLRGDDGGGGVRRRGRVASDMGGGFCGNGRRRPPARCCPAPPSITPAPSNRHRPCPTPPSTMSAQKKHRHPRLRGDDGREGVWRWAKGGTDRGAGCDGAVMSGATSAQLRPAPTTVIPAKAGIQVGVHGNGRAARGVDGHVGHRPRTRVCDVLCGGDGPGSPPVGRSRA